MLITAVVVVVVGRGSTVVGGVDPGCGGRYLDVCECGNLVINKHGSQNKTIMRFFVLVSSLKVFGHSIHSERRRRINLGNQYKTTLSYNDYSVSGLPR